tara:strand:- start:277 stop:633 length:357 start_codon:yes stop_codon:yes gene_type:complete
MSKEILGNQSTEESMSLFFVSTIHHLPSAPFPLILLPPLLSPCFDDSFSHYFSFACSSVAVRVVELQDDEEDLDELDLDGTSLNKSEQKRINFFILLLDTDHLLYFTLVRRENGDCRS